LLLAGLLPLGVGIGAASVPATTSITETLPESKQGVGSALNDLSREVGGALGIAVIGSILSASYRSNLHIAATVPQAVAGKARASFAIAVHAGGPIRAAADSAFVDGIHVALLSAAVTVLIAAVGVAALLRSGRRAMAVEPREVVPIPALPLPTVRAVLAASPLKAAQAEQRECA
jgi:hypothetical protein